MSFVIILGGWAYSSDDTLERGMELYNKHRYEEAAQLLRSSLSSVRVDRKAAFSLNLGMVYLSNAELYRELYEESRVVHLRYLKQLLTAGGNVRSRYMNLYMGDGLLEDGKIREAASYYKKFINDKQIKDDYRNMAKARLGLCYYLQGRRQEAEKIWTGIAKISDPEVLSEVAAVYSRADILNKNALEMSENALVLAQNSGSGLSMRLLKNTMEVYARAGRIKKALDLLSIADMAGFSYEEVIDKNKIIRFYDISLLGDLSTVFAQASLEYLREASSDIRVKAAADYYLGKAYAFMGDIDQSMTVMESFLSYTHVPQQLKEAGRVRQAVNQYRKGAKTVAVASWNTVIQKKSEPDLLAEILLACGSLNIDCTEYVLKAIPIAERGHGNRVSRLNLALGRYYLGKKDYEKTILYMEAARDKSNKNRIEQNHPMILVGLAKAYFHVKQFSEALEIYFEMSKQFPAVRQIQVAMQGVYSMEQKSAGDVKIY